MKTLKQEEVGGRDYRNLSHARDAIGAVIEGVYNGHRLQPALAYRPPVEFEKKHRGIATSPQSRVSAKGAVHASLHGCAAASTPIRSELVHSGSARRGAHRATQILVVLNC
jgi:hypothetical protein